MKIGNLTFKNGLFLAPMAGVTDVGFRSVCSDAGAELCYTEMVSAKGLFYDSENTADLLRFENNHRYKAVQIFGSDAEVCASICARLCKEFDLIDINMGCPAPKIFRNGDGCALMSDIDKARTIIEKCVQASSVPVTVKFRSGIDENSVNAVEFAQMCERAGASAITIHARTRNQFYAGGVDYELIEKVVKAVRIPVIGNGNVRDIASYDQMKSTGCAGVMIGRASMGNPGVFSTLLGIVNHESRYDYAMKHIEILRKYYSDNYINKYFRKHFLWYMSGISNSSEAKQQIVRASTLNEALDIFYLIMNK